MDSLKHRIAIFSIFWLIMSGYFFIPCFIASVTPPDWFYTPDNYIPFIWWMIIPYYLHYFVILSPPFLVRDKFPIILLTIIITIITLISFVFFVIWPVGFEILLKDVMPNPLSTLYNYIQLDYNMQNSFPSLHVANTGFLCLAIPYYIGKWKYPGYTLIVLVFLSTVFTKQHFLLDSVAGMVLAYVGYYYWKKKLPVHYE